MSELELRELQDTEFPIPEDLQNTIAITSLSRLYSWSRRSSLWPMLFGLACCAIEMIGTAASRFDFSRFGMEVMRATPRQADLMIVSGTVTKKMIVPIVRLYNQMPEPKYVLAMGACASGGGPFKEGYSVVSGVDKYIPTDVYVPGCPPTPQALLHGLITLQKLIDGQSLARMDDVPWYGVGPSEPAPVPILGPDIIDPRQMELIRQQAERAALGAGKAAERAALGAGKAAERALPDVIVASNTRGLEAPETVGTAATGVAESEAADGEDPEKARRIAKRLEARARLAARRAAKQGGA